MGDQSVSWLKDVRKTLELTQQDLAKLLGKDQAQVCRWEANPKQITVEKFLRICQELKLNPSTEILKL